MKILIVEDEARIASFLAKGLRAQGFLVQCVATGQEALSLAREPSLDLMILDLGLPDIDGTEILLRLRGEGSDLPVMVLTARAEESDRLDGLRRGADDYLTKPFSFDELLARVRARVRHR